MILTARKPKLTLGAILIAGLLAALVGSRGTQHLTDTGTEFLSRGTQSYTATKTLVATVGPGAFPNLEVALPPASRHAPTVLARIQRLATLLPRTYRSRNGRLSLVIGYFHRGVDPGPAAVRLAHEFRSFPDVTVGGPALIQQELVDQTRADVSTAAEIALPLLLLLGLLIFRSVIAALLPILTTVIALGVSLLVLSAVNAIFSISVLALDLTVGLTVALSLDYSLLLISRYREELARTDTSRESALTKTRTAGRTVAISSATVAVAFASSLLFPIAFVRSLALGGIVAAVTAGLVALLTLPAAFALLGEHINAVAIVPAHARTQHRAWAGIAHRVLSRPRLAVLVSLSLMAALAIPASGLRLTGFDAISLPVHASSRNFAQNVRRDFNQPLLDELLVLAKGPAGKITGQVVPAMERLPNVAAGTATHLRGSLWVFSIKTVATAFSPASEHLVRAIRALPFHLAVTGSAADYVDAKHSVMSWLPLATLLLIGLTFILLFVATGSAVLPIVAVGVNLLSFAASLGLVVFVFQHGRLTGLLDYRSLGTLLLTQPVMLGAGAFGILTDYGVFMLARIREAHDAPMSTTKAVAQGLESTGPIISSAAILFCVAVGALLSAKLVFVKELSFGIVAAVIIDVTVVRALLLPGTMTLLDRLAWWRPRILSSRSGDSQAPVGRSEAHRVAPADTAEASRSDAETSLQSELIRYYRDEQGDIHLLY
jgi:uncharacterized membrane protein YdfJ with MMPL/SSD domain